MFTYTDMILSVMQRIEVYNEIFNAISKEVRESNCGQAMNRRGRDTYLFFRNNVNRFLVEEETFRKSLDRYGEKEATKILLKGLEQYKEGIYYWLDALNDQGKVVDENQYEQGLNGTKGSFLLINQACKEACEGIQSAHSVHKM